MKINKLALFPLATLILMGCAPVSTTSSSPAESSTLPTSSETVPTSSETSAPSEVKTAWSQEELTLMETHLNGNHIPFIPLEGSQLIYDETIEVLSVAKQGGTMEEAIFYHGELLKAEWVDASEIDEDGSVLEYAAALPLEKTDQLEALFCYISIYEGTLYADYYYSILPNEWDAALINEFITSIAGEAISIPEPTFEYSCYQLDYTYVDMLGLGFIYFYVNEDVSQTYIDQLLAAGFVSEDFEGETYYNDPTGKLSVGVSYDSEFQTVDLELSYIGE